jgi:hypothetical protein
MVIVAHTSTKRRMSSRWSRRPGAKPVHRDGCTRLRAIGRAFGAVSVGGGNSTTLLLFYYSRQTAPNGVKSEMTLEWRELATRRS